MVLVVAVIMKAQERLTEVVVEVAQGLAVMAVLEVQALLYCHIPTLMRQHQLQQVHQL